MNSAKPLHHEMVIGTRGSRLALWQANHIADLLGENGITARLEVIVTKGDRNLAQPLAEIGDKGLFTAELDAALLDGRIDVAVHSLKDLPTELTTGLCLAAVPKRASPWDVLVARSVSVRSLDDLPKGAVIGSSSLRRVAQLLAVRPDLEVRDIRGNVETRLLKLHEERMDAIVLAEAGLVRLGLQEHIAAHMPVETMLPAVGQGALGVVCASSRRELRAQLDDRLGDPVTYAAVTAERAFLRRLEGGCQVPIGAYCEVAGDGSMLLHGCVATLDGSTVLRNSISAMQEDAIAAGSMLAERLVARGANVILENIRANG